MDTFKWIVTGLLTVLIAGLGWFLAEIRADVRDMRKEVMAIRIEAAATTTRVDGLFEEWRRSQRR